MWGEQPKYKVISPHIIIIKKMEKEFRLDEKTIRCVCGGDDDNRRILYHEKDIKEFIELLETEMPEECIERGQFNMAYFQAWLLKRAGPKLTK